ncbi:MAG TPA: hypothetical protein VMQ52_01045, partial [Candidatus Saccharimonadales bacterium]|nr:hypothetical protein [Candidatus Saccharimonadales bacterium]
MTQKTPLKRVLLTYVVKPLFFSFIGVLFLFIFSSLLRVQQVQATNSGSSSYINFQARLLTAGGAIVPDGNYNVEFKLYSAVTSTGGSQGTCGTDTSCLWVETRTGGNVVRVYNGYLSVSLGSVNAFSNAVQTINWNQNLWLGINVGGIGTPVWDGEMIPRVQFTASPYAFSAGQLSTYNSAQNFTSLLQFAAPMTANNVITIPDSGGNATLCLQSSSSCGFIQNQNAVVQTANFKINGTGQAAAFDAASAATLNIGITTANGIQIGSVTNTTTGVTISTAQNFTLNGVAASNYTIAAATTTGTIAIGGTSQTGALTVGASGSANTENIGTGVGATTLNLGTG